MIDRLRFRLVDLDTGEILIDHLVDGLSAEAIAVADSELARERLDRGNRVRLEVTDPDGLLFPADRWLEVDIEALRP